MKKIKDSEKTPSFQVITLRRATVGFPVKVQRCAGSSTKKSVSLQKHNVPL